MDNTKGPGFNFDSIPEQGEGVHSAPPSPVGIAGRSFSPSEEGIPRSFLGRFCERLGVSPSSFNSEESFVIRYRNLSTINRTAQAIIRVESAPTAPSDIEAQAVHNQCRRMFLEAVSENRLPIDVVRKLDQALILKVVSLLKKGEFSSFHCIKLEGSKLDITLEKGENGYLIRGEFGAHVYNAVDGEVKDLRAIPVKFVYDCEQQTLLLRGKQIEGQDLIAFNEMFKLDESRNLMDCAEGAARDLERNLKLSVLGKVMSREESLEDQTGLQEEIRLLSEFGIERPMISGLSSETLPQKISLSREVFAEFLESIKDLALEEGDEITEKDIDDQLEFSNDLILKKLQSVFDSKSDFITSVKNVLNREDLSLKEKSLLISILKRSLGIFSHEFARLGYSFKSLEGFSIQVDASLNVTFSAIAKIKSSYQNRVFEGDYLLSLHANLKSMLSGKSFESYLTCAKREDS